MPSRLQQAAKHPMYLRHDNFLVLDKLYTQSWLNSTNHLPYPSQPYRKSLHLF